jgi:ADP-ribose pyrophosphatase
MSPSKRDTQSPLAEICIESHEMAKGKLLHAFSDRVRLPDGRESVREWIQHPGAVMVLPYFPDEDELLFVRQYRYPVGRAILEFPAGKLDDGEDALACGRREMEEETGWVPEDMVKIQELLPCIGYSDEVIHLYFCEKFHAGRLQLDTGEFLEPQRLSTTQARRRFDAGEFQDSKTLVALAWFFMRQDAQKKSCETQKGHPNA